MDDEHVDWESFRTLADQRVSEVAHGVPPAELVAMAMGEMSGHRRYYKTVLARMLESAEPPRSVVIAFFLLAILQEPDLSSSPELVTVLIDTLQGAITGPEIQSAMLAGRLMMYGPAPRVIWPLLRRAVRASTGNEEVRALCACALLQTTGRNKSAMDVVVASVKRDGERVACDSAATLARSARRSKASFETFRQLLGPGDATARMNCLLAFENLGIASHKLQAMVLSILESSTSDLERAVAAEALGHCGPLTRRDSASLFACLSSSHLLTVEGALRACTRLRQFPDSITNALTRLIRDHPLTRPVAYAAIVALGPRGLDTLSLLLERASNATRPEMEGLIEAVAACCKDSPAVLAPLLHSESMSTFTVGLMALGSMGATALPVLAAVIDAGCDVMTKSAIISIFARFGSEAGPYAEWLNRLMLQETDAALAMQLIFCARGLGPRAIDTTPGLLRMLMVGDDEVAEHASQSLRAIGPAISRYVYAALFEASRTQQQRINKVLSQWSHLPVPLTDTEARLVKLRDDHLIRTFVAVASVLSNRDKLTFAQVRARLIQEKATNRVLDRIPSSSTLRVAVSGIEGKLFRKGALLDRSGGSGISLTATGLEFYQECVGYLARRDNDRTLREGG